MPANRLHATYLTFLTLCLFIMLSGCIQSSSSPTMASKIITSATPISPETPTRFVTEVPEIIIVSTPSPVAPVIWLADYLPGQFIDELNLPGNMLVTANRETANLKLELRKNSDRSLSYTSTWVYAVVTAFPNSIDHITLEEIKEVWKGKPTGVFGEMSLLVNHETRDIFSVMWGAENPQSVLVATSSEIMDLAWQKQSSLAIVPFEDIEPSWKVLRINGHSPLDKDFDPSSYDLTLTFGISGSAEVLESLPVKFKMPTNRKAQKLTTLVMTGVTALSRHIGEVMEDKGVRYPAMDINEWLWNADLTHISNEVSFYEDCPKPGPLRADMRFCSHPKYIELLKTVGTDIIELTGNHNLDWGIQPYLFTLDLYQGLGWKTYGGGRNLEDAIHPLIIEHNGNKLAFLGCSPAGPEKVWATADKPGSAPCNLDRLEQQILDLNAQGYLPIVTLQAVETDTYLPPPAQGAPNFRRLAQAGAVIVSGSQSHVPQTMTLIQSNFVHYGLGNLFFDQIDPPEARQAFIDRHIFYDGKYLGVELLTIFFEEQARPRPMTETERKNFLEEIFSLCVWDWR